MIEFVYVAALALITGALVKYADYLEDTKKEKNKFLLGVIGLAYGILIFLMVYYFPVVAPIWIGTVLGLVLFGKIDAISHNVGTATALTLSIAFTPQFLGLMLVFFVIVNIVEELASDYFEKKPPKNKALRAVTGSRPLLEISAIAVSYVTGQWAIWVAILFFDIAYQLLSKFEAKKARKN